MMEPLEISHNKMTGPTMQFEGPEKTTRSPDLLYSVRFNQYNNPIHRSSP